MKTLKKILLEAFSPNQFDAAVKPIKKTLGNSIQEPAANYIAGLEKVIKTMGQNPNAVSPKTIRQLMRPATTSSTMNEPASDPKSPGVPDVDLFGKQNNPNEPLPNPGRQPETGISNWEDELTKVSKLKPQAFQGQPEPEMSNSPELPALPAIQPQEIEPFQGTLPPAPEEEPTTPLQSLPPTLQSPLIPQQTLPQGTTYAPSLSHGATTQTGNSSWNPGTMGGLKKIFQKTPQFNTQKIGPALDPLGHKLQKSHKTSTFPSLKEIFSKKN